MLVKKLNQIESAEKFIQIEVEVKCMHTKFCGWVWAYCYFSIMAKFPFWTIDHYGGQTIKLDRIGSKNSCK